MSGHSGVGIFTWTCPRCEFTFRNLTRYGLGVSTASHKSWCWTKEKRA